MSDEIDRIVDLGVCPACGRWDGVQRCEGDLRRPDTFYCENHNHVTVWVGSCSSAFRDQRLSQEDSA